jgi:hypothetical protein
MEIVNSDYPKGDKFYPIPEKFHEQARKTMSSEMYKSTKYLVENTSRNNEYLGHNYCSCWFNSIDSVNDLSKPFPKFTLKYPTFFKGISGVLNATISNLKANYQSITRFKSLSNMPWIQGMEVSWDNVRGGIIVHNMPYEGELTTIPKSGISKEISKVLSDIQDGVGMFTLLESNIYIKNSVNRNTVDTSGDLLKHFDDAVNNKLDKEKYITLAVLTKAYECRYIRTSDRPENQPQLAYEVVKSGDKPKIPAPVRYALLYKYGGLVLPENFLDWFDG